MPTSDHVQFGHFQLSEELNFGIIIFMSLVTFSFAMTFNGFLYAPRWKSEFGSTPKNALKTPSTSFLYCIWGLWHGALLSTVDPSQRGCADREKKQPN